MNESTTRIEFIGDEPYVCIQDLLDASLRTKRGTPHDKMFDYFAAQLLRLKEQAISAHQQKEETP